MLPKPPGCQLAGEPISPCVASVGFRIKFTPLLTELDEDTELLLDETLVEELEDTDELLTDDPVEEVEETELLETEELLTEEGTDELVIDELLLDEEETLLDEELALLPAQK